MLRSLLDLIIPRTCCVCGRRLNTTEHVICTVCLMHMPQTNFLDDPYNNEMAKVFWGRIKNFEKAFAFIYHVAHSESANPVYLLKYKDKPDIGTDIGLLMGRMMKEKGFFDGIDALLPMPLAPNRLKERGYNQSEMIALGIHDVSRLPIIKKAVRRKEFKGSQTHKTRWDRVDNVEHSFELVDASKIRNKHILVIDDVVTTGATITALATELEKAGGVKISAASIAFAGRCRPVTSTEDQSSPHHPCHDQDDHATDTCESHEQACH